MNSRISQSSLTAMPLGAAERELLAGRTREVIGKGADDLAEVLRRTLLRLPKPALAVAAGYVRNAWPGS